MKKSIKIILSIVLIYLILGLLWGFILGTSPGMCTLMECSPSINKLYNPSAKDADSTRMYEIPCNSCGINKHYFITGLLNIRSECSGTEILTFEGHERIDKRYDIEENSCSLKISFGLE